MQACEWQYEQQHYAHDSRLQSQLLPVLERGQSRQKERVPPRLFAAFPLHGHAWDELLSDLRAESTTLHGVGYGGEVSSIREAVALHKALVTQCQHLNEKGIFARVSAWHSITAAVDHYDKTFVAWRFWLRAIAKELVQKGKNVTELQAEATKSLEEIMAAGDGSMDADSKEKHKAAMQEVKKKSGKGNHILICPVLMHNACFQYAAIAAGGPVSVVRADSHGGAQENPRGSIGVQHCAFIRSRGEDVAGGVVEDCRPSSSLGTLGGGSA